MVLFLGVLGLAGLVVWLYSLFDVITTPRQDVRTLPKLGWVAVVFLFFVFGAIAWLLLGRPRNDAVGSARLAHPSSTEQTAARPDPQPRGHGPPRGPDDDPEFLRRLDDPGGDDDEGGRGAPQP